MPVTYISKQEQCYRCYIYIGSNLCQGSMPRDFGRDSQRHSAASALGSPMAELVTSSSWLFDVPSYIGIIC